MKIKIIENTEYQEVEVDILCSRKDAEIEQLKKHISLFSKTLIGKKEQKEYPIALYEIYYFESVDGKTFLYTNCEVYETQYTLYSLEELLTNEPFIRIGKSCILNIHMLQHVEPYKNHRLLATLKNGETQVINRYYINALRNKMKTIY